MPLTDPEGNPIPEDDPRLPTPEAIAAITAAADEKVAMMAKAGVQLSPLVALDAQVHALVSLMVPPEGALRLVFEHRVQERRHAILDQMAQDIQQAKAGPALQIASTVPQDLRLGIKPG